MKAIIDFYKLRIKMSNGELYVFKLSVFCLSLVIGCYFADFIRPYLIPILIFGVLTSVWITIVWLKAVKEASLSN